MRLSRLPVLAVAAVLLGPASARAHDLKAAVTIGPEVVTVEGGYDDDTPADRARVSVADAAGNPVAAGVLDERGVWSFPRPGPGTYTAVVQSAGHRSTVEFTVSGTGPTVFTGWRLDKRLGLAVGLAVLLGGSLLVWLRRRARRSRGRPPLADDDPGV